MDKIIDSYNWDKAIPELIDITGSHTSAWLLSFLIGLCNSKGGDTCTVSLPYLYERVRLSSDQAKYQFKLLKDKGFVTTKPTSYCSGREVTIDREAITTALNMLSVTTAKEQEDREAYYKTINETLAFHDLDALLEVSDKLDDCITATLHYYNLGYFKQTGTNYVLTKRDMGYLLQRQSELNRRDTMPSIAYYFRTSPEKPSIYDWYKYKCSMPESPSYPETREEWDKLFEDEDEITAPADFSDFFKKATPKEEPELREVREMMGGRMVSRWEVTDPLESMKVQYA